MMRRKPLARIASDNAVGKLERHFGFYSLYAVGVGGTVGSGIFVLSGQIARTMAGPATAVSWLVAGGIALLTALSYAELSGRIPSGGSTYIFAYHGLGEVWAVIGAWLLSLEYAVSGAAVSRSWGDKFAYWAGTLGVAPSCTPTQPGEPVVCWINAPFGSIVNPAAMIASIATTAVLLRGAKMGRLTINVLVVLKVGLVVFVILAGLLLLDTDNLTPLIPPPDPSSSFIGGVHGVMLGATTAFFGYVGFDSVTCLSSEAVDPAKTVPLAVVSTVVTVIAMYILATIALTGMVPHTSISPEEGFGSAFSYLGMDWAMHLVMAGQVIVVLPTVIMVAYYPQSRLFYAMSCDGLLPPVFGRLDAQGNTYWGILMTGVFGTLMCSTLPFESLSELISGGILLSFVISNAALLVLRVEDRDNAQRRNVEHHYQPLSLLVISADTTTGASGTECNARTRKKTVRMIRDPRYSVLHFVILSGVTAYAFALNFVGPVLTLTGSTVCCAALALPYLPPTSYKWMSWWTKQFVLENEMNDNDNKNDNNNDNDNDNYDDNYNDDGAFDDGKGSLVRAEGGANVYGDANDNESISILNKKAGGGCYCQEPPTGLMMITSSSSSLNSDLPRSDHPTPTTRLSTSMSEGCDSNNSNNNNNNNSHNNITETSFRNDTFRVPLGPVLPGVAIGLNWYLLAQMSASGTFMMYALVALSCLTYFIYGAKHSVGARTNNWASESPVHETTTSSSSSSSSWPGKLGTSGSAGGSNGGACLAHYFVRGSVLAKKQ